MTQPIGTTRKLELSAALNNEARLKSANPSNVALNTRVAITKGVTHINQRIYAYPDLDGGTMISLDNNNKHDKKHPIKKLVYIAPGIIGLLISIGLELPIAEKTYCGTPKLR